MTNRVVASDELEPPKDSDKGAVYGPVPTANTAIEDQDEYPVAEFGDVPNIPTTNVKGFTPYRGGEQHGVRFTHDTKSPTPQISHYQAEQQAFENVVDPRITPRNISPVPPIRVQIVDTPQLLRRVCGDFRTVLVTPASGIVKLVGYDWNRTRLIISIFANNTTVIGWLKSKDDANKTFDAKKVVATNTGSAVSILDTESTSALFFSVDDSQLSTDAISVVLYWERPIFDGESLNII